MKIKVISIAKKEHDSYEKIVAHHIKISKQFGVEIEDIPILNKNIQNAQKIGGAESQKEYAKALEKYRDEVFSVALDPKGKSLDSFEFSDLFLDNQKVTFLIGGAYGLDRDFVNSCNISISLSALTMGHKIAKVVLYEQIYRAFSILHNHPYHK